MTHSFPTRRSSDLLIHDAKNSIDPASPAADKTDRIRTRGMPMGRKRENPGLGGRPVKHLGAVLACLIGFHALPAAAAEPGDCAALRSLAIPNVEIRIAQRIAGSYTEEIGRASWRERVC